MHILMFKAILPHPPNSGTNIVSYNLIRTLVRSHRVTLVSLEQFEGDQQEADSLRSLGVNVYLVPTPRRRGFTKRAAYALWNRTVSVVTGTPVSALYKTSRAVISTLVQAQHEEGLPDIFQVDYWDAAGLLDVLKCGLKVLFMPDVDFVQQQRALSVGQEWPGPRVTAKSIQSLRRNQIHACQRADVVLTITDADRRFVERELKRTKPVLTFPVGVDTQAWSLSRTSIGTRRILFVGPMNYLQNLDAVLYFSEKVLPIIHRRFPEVNFDIVGAAPPKSVLSLGRRPGIAVHGFIPDVKPMLDLAEAIVVPLRAGSGIKFKVLEALSVGKPLVTTTVGAEGIPIEHKKHALVNDTPQDIADSVAWIFDNPEEAQAMAQRGREFVTQRYDRLSNEARVLAFYEHEIPLTLKKFQEEIC